MDILSNKFSENEFDFIVIFETLEHIKEDGKVIQEFNRILKDNGALIISVPYAEDVQEYNEPVGACRIKEGTHICIGEGGCHYRNGYNLGRMGMLLEENGFLMESWEYLCIPKLFEASFLSFPFKYPLSLFFTNVSKNRVKLKVIAKKVSSHPTSVDRDGEPNK
jgi:SAM-dependent methyltransferase